MLDFALRSFNGLKYTARKSRCSQLPAQLHAWAGCRGHAILIKKAPSPSMSLLEKRSPCFREGDGDRGWPHLDQFNSQQNFGLPMEEEERHKWTFTHGCSLETPRKFLQCSEGQTSALALICSPTFIQTWRENPTSNSSSPEWPTESLDNCVNGWKDREDFQMRRAQRLTLLS